MNIEAHLRHLEAQRSQEPNPDRTGPVRIAILDDYQQIATKIFARLRPRISIYSFSYTLDATKPAGRNELIKRLESFEVVCAMRERTAFPAELVNALPKLKLILTTGLANAAIDLKACTERGILVLGTKGTRMPKVDAAWPPLGHSLQATAEQALALILAVTKLIAINDSFIKKGGWQTGFTTSLAGKTVGIVGFGRIGAMVARMCVLGFGMRLTVWSENLTQEKAEEVAKKNSIDVEVMKVASSKLELFKEADVISLNYVLSDRSRGLVGKEELAAMKSSAVLVNTSRGGLIDEPALIESLKGGKIGGVGLDVFTVEPLPLDSEFRTTEWGEEGRSHVVLSPHMGYAESAVIPAWYEECTDNLEEWLDGKTPDTVIKPK